MSFAAAAAMGACRSLLPRRLRRRAIQLAVALLLLLPLLLLLLRSSGGAQPLRPLSRPSLSIGTPSRRQLKASPQTPAEAAPPTAEAAAGSINDTLSTGTYWAKVRRHFPNGGADSPQYRLLEARCRSGNASGPVGFSDPAYLVSSAAACRGRVSIVLAVHSAVDHADRRRVIRRTWGSVRYVRGRQLRLVFFLGRPAEPRLQALVEAEATQHGDIVQRDFLDTYRNMTLKHLGLYDWLAEFCQTAEWLVKLDDDVFVDVFHLESFLTAYKPAGICCKLQDGGPEREPGNKWYVTRAEFPGDKYPKYCEGYAYVMRPTVAQLLYWCSVFSTPLWIDDVYVLGLLVRRLGLQPQEPVGGHLWADLMPSHTGRAIADNIFLVDRRNGLQPSTWRRLQRAAMRYSY